MVGASDWWLEGAGGLSLGFDAFGLVLKIGCGDRREQRLSVGVLRGPVEILC